MTLSLTIRLTHRGSSLMYGIHKANCVMAEADAMVGDASRAPLSISAKVGLEDGFVLSGMRLGNGTQVSQSVIPQAHSCASELVVTTDHRPSGYMNSHHLSGICVCNGAQVWRFTPSDEVQVPAVKIVTTSPATFEVAGRRVVPVAGGVLVAAPVGSCAPAGYWIVRPPQAEEGA